MEGRIIADTSGIIALLDRDVNFTGNERATDTVTNFTTLVGDFVTQKLHNIYLITSDDHMRRARAIATIVLGSRGIAVTPVEMLSRA